MTVLQDMRGIGWCRCLSLIRGQNLRLLCLSGQIRVILSHRLSSGVRRISGDPETTCIRAHAHTRFKNNTTVLVVCN